MHCPHIPLLQQGSSALSVVNTRNVGNWDGRELGFACPLRTELQQAQIHVSRLNPTPAGVIMGWDLQGSLSNSGAGKADGDEVLALGFLERTPAHLMCFLPSFGKH